MKTYFLKYMQYIVERTGSIGAVFNMFTVNMWLIWIRLSNQAKVDKYGKKYQRTNWSESSEYNELLSQVFTCIKTTSGVKQW